MAKVENFSLTNFMANMKFGARPNQFMVELYIPQAVLSLMPNSNAVGGKFRFGVMATSIPDSTNGNIPLKFRNQTYNLPGDKTFGTWPITIRNDSDFLLRDVFEHWSDAINGNTEGDQIDVEDPTALFANGEVLQLDKNSNILKAYDIYGAWPLTVGTIDLDYESADAIESFPVDLQFQIWESSTTRNRSDGSSYVRGGQSITPGGGPLAI